jgi:hypothetical protein
VEAQDVVEAAAGVGGKVEDAAQHVQILLGALPRRQPEGPVVDELDGGVERPASGEACRPVPHDRDRTRCRYGADTLRAVGQEVGVALVEADDGVAQPVGGEELRPRAPSSRVDLDQEKAWCLEGADVEPSNGRAGGRCPVGEERERIAEGRQRLDPVRRLREAQQRPPHLDGAPPLERDTGGVVDDLAVVRDLGGDRVDVSGGDQSFEARRALRCRVRHDPAVNTRRGLDTRLDRPIRTHARKRTAGPLGEHRGALGLPQLDRPSLLDLCFVAMSRLTQRCRERQAGVGVMQEGIGRGGQVDGGGMLPASRQGLGPHAPPGDRGLEVVARERLAVVAERLGVGGSPLKEQRTPEERGGPRRVDREPVGAEPLVGDAQCTLGAGGVALEEIDQPREDVGHQELLGDAELLDHASRGGDHPPRRFGTPAQRLEHGLAAERHGLDRRRPLGDAQHAHDVEAAAAGPRDRARSPQGGERRVRQHPVRAAPIAGAPRRGQRPVERRLAGADLAESRERQRVHRMRLRLARAVAGRRQVRRRGGDCVDRGMERLRVGEHGELAGEARVPGAQPRRAGREAAELVERFRGRADVAGGEERLAPVERQVGATGIGRVEPIERAAEQACRGRQVVAPERPPSRRRKVVRRALAERAAVRVDLPELPQVLMRLLEVPADGLVVLDRVAGLARDPVGDTLVQLRPRPLEHATVGGVAGEAMVEAQRRLAQEPGRVGLDQLAAPERFQARVEIGLLPRQQVGEGGARELPADHRRALEHRAFLRTQPLDANGEQRVDGGRHLELRDLDPGGPAVALALQRAVLDEHADQLADEERVALAGREHAARDRGRELLGADHARGEPHRCAAVEAGERDHVGDETSRRRERRARVAQLRAPRREHEQRHAAAPLDQVLDQVEQQRLRPLEIVDREHDRLRRRERGEEAAHDEERLLRRRGRAGE